MQLRLLLPHVIKVNQPYLYPDSASLGISVVRRGPWRTDLLAKAEVGESEVGQGFKAVARCGHYLYSEAR